MAVSKRQQICDLLSEWILEVKAGVMREHYVPSRNPDESDDMIKDGEEMLVKLRALREQVEEV